MYNHTDNNRQMTKPTKKGMKRVSPKAPAKPTKKTHKMPDGTVMSGTKHNSSSKPVAGKRKKTKPMGKVKKTISY